MTQNPAAYPSSRPTRRPFWPLAIALGTFLFYLPALRNLWIWDDGHYITDNIYLATLHGLHQLWFRPGAVPQYYPLTHTTFWLEHHLWGNEPMGFHFDNIVLHITNAILLGLLLRRLQVPGYAWAAALFALHPVQVESVAWATERKNVLSGFFYLTCMWLALDLWKITPPAPALKRWRTGPLGYGVCLLLFVGALLSKSVTSSLPAVVILLMWWKHRPITLAAVGKLLPFFVLGAAMGSVTAWMEAHVVGATGPDFNWSPAMRVLIAGRAICFYLAKLAWPHPLIFIYPKWRIDPTLPWEWAFPAAVVVGLLALFFLRRVIGRGPIVAAMFFVVTLFPALGFVNVYPMRYSFVADHFQYLACIAPLTLAAMVLRRAVWIAVPVLLVLGVLTSFHTTAFYDMPTIFADVVTKDPDSVLGHCNLGAALIDQGKLAEAGVELQKCLALDPTFPEAWCALGSVAERQNDPDQAMGYYRAAQTAAPENPIPLWRMGLLDRRRGNIDAAVAEFTADLRYLHNPAPAYEQLGEIELARDHAEAAKKQFDLALTYNPDLASAHNNLAQIALSADDGPTAFAQTMATLSIDPDDTTALNNMGFICLLRSDPAQAADFFRRVLEIDPNFKLARQNLDLLARQRASP